MKRILGILLSMAIVCSVTVIPISVSADQLNQGMYNFVCADGGRYLNVYAGNDWDGVNVCVWEKDGSPEQNFNMIDRGGNRYVLYPSSSGGRVLDANRGNSYSNPLRAGNNIDIWQTNDAEAQEWYIDDRGGGRYTIELVHARGLVVACDNPGANGGNCSLQSYTGASNQLWYLQRTDGGTVKPESESSVSEPNPSPAPAPETSRTGYVSNTGGWVLNIRSQATTNSAVIGKLSEGSSITIKGDGTTNGFWKVDYNGQVGYCHSDYISFSQPSTPPAASGGSSSSVQSKYQQIVNSVGWQTQKAVSGRWDWACGAYCTAYARSFVDNRTRYASEFWHGNLAYWTGGWSRAVGSDAQMLSAAKSALDNGKPCVVTVNSSYGQHYVLAIYYTGSGTGTNDFVVIDPWNGQIKSLANYTLNYYNKQVVSF